MGVQEWRSLMNHFVRTHNNGDDVVTFEHMWKWHPLKIIYYECKQQKSQCGKSIVVKKKSFCAKEATQSPNRKWEHATITGSSVKREREKWLKLFSLGTIIKICMFRWQRLNFHNEKCVSVAVKQAKRTKRRKHVCLQVRREREKRRERERKACVCTKLCVKVQKTHTHIKIMPTHTVNDRK